MPGRWFNFAVLGFWLVSMSWLVTQKVLPPLRVGEPPNYRAIIERDKLIAPTCWLVYWRNEPLGWAASRLVRQADGMNSLQGQIFLDHLPLQEMASGWLGSMIKPLLRLSSLSLGAVSQMDVDPLGQLVSFDSRLSLVDGEESIHIRGQVEASNLQLTVQAGDVSFKEDRYLTPGAFVADQLAPLSVLPNLHVGQTWTMPVFNPFRSPKNSMEILQATVERSETIRWHGTPIEALLVVYRSDPGASSSAQLAARSKLWVSADGTVLKQEMMILNSPLTFIRTRDDKGDVVSAALGGDWRARLSSGEARSLLAELESDDSAP